MADPFTGLMIPKTLAGNLAWRKQMLRNAQTSETHRRMLKKASASSPVFWINAFAWTFLQKEINASGVEQSIMGEGSHVPFVTWKVQDEAIVDIHEAIVHGKPILIRKSRDMGASWIVVALFQWFWQFRPSSTFLEISRKESLVDRRGDMDSLFEKHRYLLRWQPEWLRPTRMKDQKLHLENNDIGTTIEGESTNENAGQASRKSAILLDEFARVPNGEEIDLATADTAACRIFLSTPQGPNTAYSRISRAMRAGQRAGKIVELMWFRHPKKAIGLAPSVEDDRAKRPYVSLWLQDQITKRSRKNVAMNIWAEDGESGDMFFDADEIALHRKMHERDPDMVGNVLYDEELGQDAKKQIVQRKDHAALAFIQNGSRRPWRMWTTLIEGRPNQQARYVFACDISAGSGASNSVISVLDHTTNRIVAKWWDAFTSPEAMAEIAVLSAIWFGGKDLPTLIFEKNGPGIIFGKKVMSMGYPRVYFDTVEDKRSKTTTSKWGWHSTTSKKEMLLGQYREALKINTIINPCREALNECLDYVYDESGRLEPGITGEEAQGGSALHGDHVISDALLILGRSKLPKSEKDQPVIAPEGSFAFRRKLYEQRERERDVWTP